MTTEDIRMRNWQKSRIMGFSMNTNVLTHEEAEICSTILDLKIKLLDKWDNNTEVLIGHPLPPYKCEVCWKRSNREYIIEGILGRENLCKKCFNIYMEDSKNIEHDNR